ncbi:hypothetical protein RCG23_02225 [Neobacillus sp. PS3-34]|uniref:hypothetical protein n=1 Tax=Neobacillus sp. PS3-34 TaxID=3070678 RepID=UPI0027DEF956|nr:hypothetical protein [Neobacillus sp. PS3-34]WML48951.1 hypothetical protein RCG23_02225 [Neobacillus sp. PS3-34]
MDAKFIKPKRFGEILDHTFSLTKSHFKDFFMIFLILMGPVYLLEAIVQLASGMNFFRQMGSGGSWYEKLLSGYQNTGSFDAGNISADIGLVVTGLLGFILYPVAEAAILFAVDHIRKNEEYTVRSLIKQAFSRFWPMLGSTLLFALIAIGMIVIPILAIAFSGGIASVINPIFGIVLAIILFFGFAIGIGLLLTKWSFYFGSVVLDKNSPGLTRSWRLTKKRTWKMMGMFIVFYLIISIFSFGVQTSFLPVLGNSVLLSIISNIVSLFTTLFFSVGYGVMYLDLKTRHDADDLKAMIEDYETPTLINE